MSCFNSWNLSNNYMCSKLSYLEEAENAISRPQSHQKRSEIGEDTSSHDRNIAFYLASFSNSKYLFALKVTQNFHLIELTVFIIKFLQFSNSLVNVMIYPFRIPEFKRTLFQILNFCVIPFRRLSIAVSPSAGTGSFSQSNVHHESSL